MNSSFFHIYAILLKEYGPQGWWPIGTVYRKRLSLTNDEKFEIIVGAILTQNTAWTNVEKALHELRRNNCLTIKALLETKQETLAQYIKSSGYNNQKAERLKIVAQFLFQYSLEELQNMDMKELRALLLSVKGIGPETADSIMLYAFMKPIFVIDAYTKRIMSRIGLCSKDSSYDELQAAITHNMEKDTENYNEYHALLVEHAKRYCRTKPLCEECVLKEVCMKRM
jgi:endonuclease-3 related protein